jgi:hypothetical protein
VVYSMRSSSKPISASFCGSPRCFHSVLESICNGRRCPGCLARCFGDLIARSFQH